jgi:starch synthase
MNVALVTPEFYSLIRRSNLASVAESLAHALIRAGNQVKLFIPRAKSMDADLLLGAIEVGRVTVEDPEEGPIEFAILETRVKELPVLIFDQPRWFNDRYPYGDDNGPYLDNWHRYALFSRAVLESLKVLRFTPRVIHCLDWTTGLLPVLHDLEYADRPDNHPAKKAGTWFSIHNLAMQGIFERDILPRIGIPHSYFQEADGVALDGKVNFLKAGAEFATVIGTHSLAHAERIRQRDRGHGLEKLFERRKKELVGIHNGIDYMAWDPTRDPALAANFSATDSDPTKAKLKCKAALQKTLGLDNGPRQPIACLVGRWDADNGFDLLANSFPDILERGVELVILGQGPPELTQKLKTLETTFAGRVRVIEGFTPHVAHQMMGGADFLVLPSHYQPSNPMFAIAMRYGVVPLIYKESGLEDKVVDVAKSDEGTGFHFGPYTTEALLGGLDDVLAYYKRPADWKGLVKRCLAQDFSWEHTAEEYTRAYRRVTRRARKKRNEL